MDKIRWQKYSATIDLSF